MRDAAALLPCPLVHVLDRGADSVGHYRRWAADGRSFLVRADAAPTVSWRGCRWTLGDVARRLAARKAFRPSRTVPFRGRKATQEVAETEVVLARPACPHRRRGRVRHCRVPGRPVTLRLVVSRIRDAKGRAAATWLLLTNVPAHVDAAEIALWYYWRWRIESYFKLLKGAGQQLEHWQQGTAAALAKRLLVASMACVVVWRLQRTGVRRRPRPAPCWSG